MNQNGFSIVHGLVGDWTRDPRVPGPASRHRYTRFEFLEPLLDQHDLQLAPGVGSRARLLDHEQSLAVSATHHWQRDVPRFEQRLCVSVPGAG